MISCSSGISYVFRKSSRAHQSSETCMYVGLSQESSGNSDISMKLVESSVSRISTFVRSYALSQYLKDSSYSLSFKHASLMRNNDSRLVKFRSFKDNIVFLSSLYSQIESSFISFKSLISSAGISKKDTNFFRFCMG